MFYTIKAGITSLHPYHASLVNSLTLCETFTLLSHTKSPSRITDVCESRLPTSQRVTSRASENVAGCSVTLPPAVFLFFFIIFLLEIFLPI